MEIQGTDIPDAEIREWFLSRKKQQQSHRAPPTILQLEVTKNCNLKCIMCHKGQDPLFNRTDVSDEVLKQLKPAYPYLKIAMLFGDGEPLVYKGFWNVVRDIRQVSPDCCINFITNGTMMYGSNIHKCFEYEISSIGLSLGGAKSETHNRIKQGSSFSDIISNFKILYEMKKERETYEPYIGVKIVVMQSTYKELPDLVDLCHEIGAYDIEFQTLFVTHPSMEAEVVDDKEVEPYISEAKKKARLLLGQHCPTDRIFRNTKADFPNTGYCKFQQPWNTVYVLHDGTVVPDCHWWQSTRKRDLNICGRLNKDTDIFDIWNGHTYNTIRQKISQGIILPQCRGCGLAGGVIEKYRSHETTHADPNQENAIQADITEQKINGKPELSIVIPTLDSSSLQLCLKSLLSAGCLEKSEVVIADDSDGSEIETLVNSFTHLPFLKYGKVSELIPKNIRNKPYSGLGHSLGTKIGYNLASSDLLLFVHDDIEVTNDKMLSMMRTGMENPNLALTGPWVDRSHLESPYAKMFSHVGSVFLMTRRDFIEECKSHFSSGRKKEEPWLAHSKKKFEEPYVRFYFETWAWCSYYALCSEKWEIMPIRGDFGLIHQGVYGSLKNRIRFHKSIEQKESDEIKLEEKKKKISKKLEEYAHVPL